MNKWYKIVISLFVIVFLVVAGGIAWFYYYYLPHAASTYQATTSGITTTAQDTVAPSPKTAAAMLAIEALTKGYPAGYLDAVPVPRTLSPASPAVFSTFSYQGFTFNVPWQGISTSTRRGNPPVFLDATFTNGRRVTFMKADLMGTTTLAQWTSVSSTITTYYDFESAVLNAAPDQVTNSTPGDQAAIISLLLDEKLIIFSPMPVYSFDTGILKGFQYGDATTTRQIAIDLFDNNNNKYTLIVSGTQGEIDYILASIRPD